MKWAIQAKEEEKNKPQTFSADGWTGNQRSSKMWWRNEQELLSLKPRTVRNKCAEWLERGEREGDKGAKAFCPGWRHQPGQKGGLGSNRDKRLRGPFVPVGATNRDKRPPFCPGWCLQPGQKAHVPSAGPASRWIRDKSHLLFRAQRLPRQMNWNKALFCNSDERERKAISYLRDNFTHTHSSRLCGTGT